MTAIFKLCGFSSLGAVSEVIAEQCPQRYRQFEHLPQLCGGDYDKATIALCTECWSQQTEGGRHG